jgi:hypothetical protein
MARVSVSPRSRSRSDRRDVPARWAAGQRVEVGWHAWQCGYCDSCRRSDFFACQTGIQVTGISFDGGYADYMVAPATALAQMPADLPAAETAPRICAGLTTFNALRKPDTRESSRGLSLVAVSGTRTIWSGRRRDYCVSRAGPCRKHIGIASGGRLCDARRIRERSSGDGFRKRDRAFACPVGRLRPEELRFYQDPRVARDRAAPIASVEVWIEM